MRSNLWPASLTYKASGLALVCALLVYQQAAWSDEPETQFPVARAGSAASRAIAEAGTKESATTESPTTESATTEAATTEAATTESAGGTSDAAVRSIDDESHRVLLNFRDEEWLPALEWLAKELELNLDWQTLPEGKLSLFSSTDYSLREAEDLINMQLLARGFTLLKRGEVVRLVPMKEIDITLVPRVMPEELAELEKHQVVRVSLPLEWMVAEKAALEFKPLLSPHGQMFPMASSNRLEVLDAVVNLRELVRLVARAESDDGRRIRVLAFQLKHRKAAEVAIQVRQLLGLPADGSPAVSTQTQLEIEQARFRAEAVKQLGNAARDLLSDKKPDTFLVVNEKENSIVVNAPPDKLEMVRQTIETLDKPLPESDSSWQTVSRVKVHPVNGFDPETISRLLLALQERGNLSKETRIQHESAYNRIIAFASPEDQLTISQLIESYRAEKRSASVIALTSVSPQYAVKAVQLILKNPERPSSTPGVASDGKFQIEADPENKRLLVWATSEELKEVRDFLMSLGETFEQPTAHSQMHVVTVGATDIADVTDRLRKVWEEVSEAPLVIERKPERLSPQPQQDDQTDLPALPTSAPKELGKPRPQRDDVKLVSSSSDNDLAGESQVGDVQDSDAPALAQGQNTRVEAAVAIDSPQDNPSDDPATMQSALPPVRIIEGKKGDIVIISRDPEAAGTAKRLLQQLVPDPGDVRVIALKHAQAMIVRRQLEEMLQHTSSSAPSKLSTQNRLSIEVDPRTNRLIIQHSTAEQLELINQYVPLLDQPPADQERMTRQQRVYRVKHRRAPEVAGVVKEVYRDLLSINDRAYSNSNNRPIGYNKNMAATASNPEYQGLMAVGTDTEANLLVISAPGYLMDEVIKLAESVDTPSDGPALAVIPAAGDSSDIKMREALSKILKKR